MSKRSPRLQFSDEEKAAPELKKAIQKAEKQSDKLDKAEAKIPKKTVQKKQFVVDADGKVTKHLHFEEVDTFAEDMATLASVLHNIFGDSVSIQISME